MALTFLCPVHRDWVYFHPQEALSYLEGAQSQGELLMHQQSWQEASVFLGCAFETTEILMELHGAAKSFLLSRLTSLAVLSANCFAKLNVSNYAQLILERAEQKLELAAENSLGNKPRHAYIQQCLSAIRTSQEQIKLPHPFMQPELAAQIH